MRRSLLAGLVLVLFAVLGAPAWADPPGDVDATCEITCTVGQIMEWASNFDQIDLGTISTRNATPEGSESVYLYTNGNVDIIADNTGTAQLSGGSGDTLVTEYKLEYDSDGSTNTGGSTVDYSTHDSFLDSASTVTHVAGDGAVQVTLGVKAMNETENVADAGAYSATQTLTASWGS